MEEEGFQFDLAVILLEKVLPRTDNGTYETVLGLLSNIYRTLSKKVGVELITKV